MTQKKARVIAFYLPQYHPIAENDNWWGKGFTEWTNVGKAKPLFKGHNQPRVPTDLGYYDLRLQEVREAQAEMAREAGIEGFIYWHYWFGNGKRLMEFIFDEVLESGKPDFPFCLGWANHSWYAKDWNSDGVRNDKLLIEQTYPGDDDYRLHFEYAVRAFKDSRYIKVNDRPILFIYDTNTLPSQFLTLWNKWAIQEGFKGIHFVGRLQKDGDINSLEEIGYNAFSSERMWGVYSSSSLIKKSLFRLKNFIFRRPKFTLDYKDAYPYFSSELDKNENIYPSIYPNWDHSPRSGNRGLIIHNSKPEYFEQHVKKVLEIIKNKKEKNRIVFLKSWNEWAEGNYMEPDIINGKSYLDILSKVLKEN